MPRVRLLAPLMSAALAIAGCSTKQAALPADTTAPPSTESVTTTAPVAAALPVPAPLAFTPCGDGIECATLTVPLDYADPQRRSIDLAVARQPARHPERKAGTVVVDPGGPGGSGVGFLRAGGMEQFDEFDVVAWDPRGVDESAGLTCGRDVEGFLGLDPAPDTPDEQAQLDTSASALASQCEQDDPALLRHIDTTVVATDLDQIRAALGEAQLTYLGFSYGTLIGEEYLRAFPQHVRAMVLDGVVNPATSLEEMLRGQAIAMEAAIADVADVYDRVAARVETDPLPSGNGGTVGPDRLVLAAIASTYDGAEGHRALRAALADADRRGDGTALDDLGARYVSADTSFGAYVSVLCADGPHPTGADAWRAMADRLGAVAPRVGAAAANEVLACAFWAAPPTRQPAPLAVADVAPVLVVGNTGDAATPYADARTVAASLPGAVLLTYDDSGHTASTRSACVADVVRRYLADLTLPAPGTVCPAGS